MLMSDCRLCKITEQNVLLGTDWLPTYSIMSTHNFHIVPSLGSLVEGWTMIVSKEHLLCMGELSYDKIDELLLVKKQLTQDISTIFGKSIAFEHGPSSPGGPIGCGVDHAHIHFVPVDIDLPKALSKLIPFLDLEWQEINDYRDVRSYFLRGLPYLYIEQPSGFGYIATNMHFPSQFVRKAIADHLGIPDHYDWNRYPFHQKMIRTINIFQGLESYALHIFIIFRYSIR